jgi:iron complex transport system substrate-binding protein
MVEMSGGRDVLGVAGTPSRQVGWNEVVRSQAEVVVVMPCGFGLERSTAELTNAELPAEWETLPAVHADEVYVVDGSSYFNRPGPRLVDGVEILASLLHPDAFSQAPPGSFLRVSQSVSPSKR